MWSTAVKLSKRLTRSRASMIAAITGSLSGRGAGLRVPASVAASVNQTVMLPRWCKARS
jgi:hypothetical protein